MRTNERNVTKRRSRRRERRRGRRHNDNSNSSVIRTVGLILAMIQALATSVFMVVLLYLDMLPSKYLLIIALVLFGLAGITACTQFFSKKKGIAGKVVCVLMSIILLVGSFYVVKANGMVNEISGSNYKLDNIVVAVMKDDAAETIQDAANYEFGVQYAMGADDVRSTVADMNKEVGSDIAATEYASLSEQAIAFHDGEVDAIIYNEGYTGILEEAFEGFSQNTKIIYQHSIKKEVDSKASKVSVKDNTFSVFLSGIDVFGAIATNSRSDVNIIATVNPETHQVLLITTPRDYYVEIPDVTGGQKDKLTHAGIYGVDASMRTLEELYDMNIDFYARVNFTSLIEIVDVLGGVDVESELAFTTSEDSGLVMQVNQGTNHFNGKQALAFSRERQNIEGGDNQRGKNQQAVITAIIRKMISPSMLINANGLINSVSGNVETNMSQDQIQDLVKAQLNSGGSWNIKSMAAEGTEDSQYCYSYAGMPLYVAQPVETSVNAIKEAVDEVENGELLSDSVTAE